MQYLHVLSMSMNLVYNIRYKRTLCKSRGICWPKTLFCVIIEEKDYYNLGPLFPAF